MPSVFRRFVIAALMCLLPAGAAAAQEGAANPLEIHFARMLAGTGQWRTPNEDFDPADPDSVSHFGSDFRLAEDGSHVIAEIIGVTPDGRRAHYWSIHFFLNPVTQEVISQQTGWSGAYMSGHEHLRTAPLAFGEEATVDQIVFNTDGQVSILRHVAIHTGEWTHTTQTYVRGEDGGWTPQNFREWTRVREEG